ncbi:hypothetical protein EDD85DRAFT_798467 [Armillaria nabsnona]|nr:hypothetical protein EDD85DRAFT_798467 [Armillaria nabsnona]
MSLIHRLFSDQNFPLGSWKTREQRVQTVGIPKGKRQILLLANRYRVDNDRQQRGRSQHQREENKKAIGIDQLCWGTPNNKEAAVSPSVQGKDLCHILVKSKFGTTSNWLKNAKQRARWVFAFGVPVYTGLFWFLGKVLGAGVIWSHLTSFLGLTFGIVSAFAVQPLSVAAVPSFLFSACNDILATDRGFNFNIFWPSLKATQRLNFDDVACTNICGLATSNRFTLVQTVPLNRYLNIAKARKLMNTMTGLGAWLERVADMPQNGLNSNKVIYYEIPAEISKHVSVRPHPSHQEWEAVMDDRAVGRLYWMLTIGPEFSAESITYCASFPMEAFKHEDGVIWAW